MYNFSESYHKRISSLGLYIYGLTIFLLSIKQSINQSINHLTDLLPALCSPFCAKKYTTNLINSTMFLIPLAYDTSFIPNSGQFSYSLPNMVHTLDTSGG
jgi:hypothetical protein